ncbi:MAG: Crp/Fnr family transcriptional regulator [Saprospiraceae bacterium]|nr:Crp/Fnr family transcriptional regulator [Saprospiraceae bacterium]
MLPKEDVEDIVRAFAVRLRLKKGECLVVPGQRSTFLAFINSGSFRVHFINHKGEEITTWFSFAGMFVTDLLSYYKDCPAMYYVEALEESEVLVAQKSHLDRLYLERPEYREFGRKFAENGMVLLMERMVSLQTKSAEERYLELLARPEFMKKIPLKHLATYLGITDSSLSRIRKSIY